MSYGPALTNLVGSLGLPWIIHKIPGKYTETNLRGRSHPDDQPEGEVPTNSGLNRRHSDQPKSLGPLASSPLVPLAGGLIGTAAGWLLSLLGNRAITGISKPGSIPTSSDGQEKYWSERPWDEAGPGYVTKEEYERTKHFLDQGYKWTNGGWQTPEQDQ